MHLAPIQPFTVSGAGITTNRPLLVATLMKLPLILGEGPKGNKQIKIKYLLIMINAMKETRE